jgi:hypothetical protein
VDGRCSILHNAQTGCGAHPASYPMGTGGKAAEAYSSPPSSAEVKNGGAIPPHPCLHGMVLN